MNFKRGAHSMVFVEGDLIVIGGLGEDCKMLSSCERYSVNDDKWEALPDLNIASMNSSVCVFNQRFLYKFGGNKENDELANIIEKLDLKRGEWEIIQFNNNSIPRIPSSGCVFQISNNNMLFFGGTFDLYSEKSDKIWLCTVHENSLEIIEVEQNLPIAEGFWMQQPLVYNNSGKLIKNFNIKFIVFKMLHIPIIQKIFTIKLKEF